MSETEKKPKNRGGTRLRSRKSKTFHEPSKTSHPTATPQGGTRPQKNGMVNELGGSEKNVNSPGVSRERDPFIPWVFFKKKTNSGRESLAGKENRKKTRFFVCKSNFKRLLKKGTKKNPKKKNTGVGWKKRGGKCKLGERPGAQGRGTSLAGAEPFGQQVRKTR